MGPRHRLGRQSLKGFWYEQAEPNGGLVLAYNMGSQYRFTGHTNVKAYTTMTWMDIKKGFVVVGECSELTLTT